MPTARNNELQRGLLIVGAVLFVGMLAAYATTLHWQDGWLREAKGYVIGRDFLNFWMAGKAAFEADPAQYYDPEIYTQKLQGMLHSRYKQQWSYPPTILLAAAPFGLLPYLAAWLLWTALGVGLLWRAVQRGPRALALALMVSPAVLVGLLCGQSSLLTGAAVLCIFRWRRSRPWVAGILLGLLTLKPQVALMVPVLLLAERNWRTLTAAAATALAMLGATVAMHGVDLLRAYVEIGVPAQSQVLREPGAVIVALMPTVYIQAWMLGAAYGCAMVVQAVAAVAMSALVYRAGRRGKDEAAKFAVLAAALVLGTPYLLSYDTVPLVWAALLLSARGLSRCERWVIASVYCLPMLLPLATLANLPVGWVPTAALLWCGWRRLGEGLQADVAPAETVRPVD